MKNTDGQLYTIEGFAAGMIMLITAFMVVNATSVYTAGDTHISDMQLEALGSDALTMMGTPTNTTMYLSNTSPLRMIIENPVHVPNETFRAMFLDLTNGNETGLPIDYNTANSTMDYIQFNANYTCRVQNNNPILNNTIESYPISYSRNLTGGEHTVRATKWVIMNTDVCGTAGIKQDRAVLVEVLLWRD
jgi:hypothetical protein